MEDIIVYDCPFNKKFSSFSELTSLYDDLSEEEKDNMILLYEICENSKKLEDYFETMKEIINPLVTRAESSYFINALTSYYEDNSESYELEIYKNFDINFATRKKKNSKIFLSWDRNQEGLERIACGINFAEDIYFKEFRNTKGEDLYLDRMKFIPDEKEVNNWILDQILLDKKRESSIDILQKHF